MAAALYMARPMTPSRAMPTTVGQDERDIEKRMTPMHRYEWIDNYQHTHTLSLYMYIFILQVRPFSTLTRRALQEPRKLFSIFHLDRVHRSQYRVLRNLVTDCVPLLLPSIDTGCLRLQCTVSFDIVVLIGITSKSTVPAKNVCNQSWSLPKAQRRDMSGLVLPLLFIAFIFSFGKGFGRRGKKRKPTIECIYNTQQPNPPPLRT